MQYEKQENAVVLREIARELTNRSDLNLVTAYKYSKEIFDIIKEHLYNKTAVRVPRFGVFYLMTARGKLFHIPSTGETIYKPTRLVPKFKPYRKFKEQVSDIPVPDAQNTSTDDLFGDE